MQKNDLNRRSFLKGSALGGGAVAAATLATPALAARRRKLTMVTSWGRGLAGVFDAAQRVADNVNTITDGSLQIEIKAAGELVGAFEVFDAVSSGQADMYHAADYYFINQHPAFAFFSSIPFGMTASELNNWYYHGNGQAFHDELGSIFGLKSFLAGNTGAQAGGWFRREIRQPGDFRGLKFRMPGLGGNVLGKMGASVQNIPGAEVYQALASGAIDGTEWIGPWADEKAGFQEITKFYYTAGFHEPGSGLSTVVNRDVFDSLTPSQQKAIEVSAAATNLWNLSQFRMNNGAALERLKKGGVQVLEFPDSVWNAMGRASRRVFGEYMGDSIFREIFDDYQKSMRLSSGWLKESVDVFRAQRDRILG